MQRNMETNIEKFEKQSKKYINVNSDTTIDAFRFIIQCGKDILCEKRWDKEKLLKKIQECIIHLEYIKFKIMSGVFEE